MGIGIGWVGGGEPVGVGAEVEAAALGDGDGAVQCGAVAGKQGSQFCFGLEVLLVGGQGRSVGLVDVLAAADGVEQVQGDGVLGRGVPDVSGDHGLQAQVGRELTAQVVERVLPRKAGVLQLDVEVVRPEDVGQALQIGPRAFGLARPQCGAQGSVEPAGQDDEAVLVRLQQVPVDARPVVHAIEDGGGDELAEVAVAGGLPRADRCPWVEEASPPPGRPGASPRLVRGGRGWTGPVATSRISAPRMGWTPWSLQ